MSDESAHESMESYAELAAEEATYRREKDDALDAVSDRLTRPADLDVTDGSVSPNTNFAKF